MPPESFINNTLQSIAWKKSCLHAQMLSFRTTSFFLFKCSCWKNSWLYPKFFFIFATWQKMVVFTINMTFEHKPVKKTMSWDHETNSSCIHRSFIYTIHPSIALFNKVKKWSLIGPSFGIGQGFKVEWGGLKCTRLLLVPSTNSRPSIESLHFKSFVCWVMLQILCHLNHLS